MQYIRVTDTMVARNMSCQGADLPSRVSVYDRTGPPMTLGNLRAMESNPKAIIEKSLYVMLVGSTPAPTRPASAGKTVPCVNVQSLKSDVIDQSERNRFVRVALQWARYSNSTWR